MEDHEAKVRSLFNSGKYFSNNSQIEARVKIVNSLVGDVRNRKILDLGCGDGAISRQYLNETNTIALVDFSEDMLKLALRQVPDKLRSNVSVHNMKIEEYFSYEKYHLILCVGVLAHVPSIEKVVQKTADLVDHDGLIVIQINDLDQIAGKLLYRYASWVNHKENHYWLTPTRCSQLIEIAADCGLELVKTVRSLSHIPGAGLLSAKWRTNLQLLSTRNHYLSIFRSEAFLLFRRRLDE